MPNVLGACMSNQSEESNALVSYFPIGSDNLIQITEAAINGESTLLSLLETLDDPQRDRTADLHESDSFEPSEQENYGEIGYLRKLTVTSFRGIGEESTINFRPDNGLTIVTGSNGTGKSSFVEALETLLTGTSLRWEDRSAEFKQGWRNLHSANDPSLIAEFTSQSNQEGQLSICASWDDFRKVESIQRTVQTNERDHQDLEGYKWVRRLSTFRPLLTFNEISQLIEQKPSDRYDAISAALGLSWLEDAITLLRRVGSNRSKPLREIRKEWSVIERSGMEGLPHDVTDLLVDIDTAIREKDINDELIKRTSLYLQSQVGVLTDMQQFERAFPEESEIADLRTGIMSYIVELGSHALSLSQRSHLISQILTDTLRLCEEFEQEDCPVCKAQGVLDHEWINETRLDIPRIEEDARVFEELESLRNELTNEAMGIIHRLDDSIIDNLNTREPSLERLKSKSSSWIDFNNFDDLTAVLEHIETYYDPLRAAYLDAQDEFDSGHEHDSLMKAQLLLRKFIEESDKLNLTNDLDSAKDILKEALESIRSERFAPIAERSKDLWKQLSFHSSVDLNEIVFTGADGSRRVKVGVTVDGSETSALSVMSQGEMHALALSLFLPRVEQDQNPFKFLIIDDPVQAMDPRRVEGLAEVLYELSHTRQVIVFTHDDRLAESTRRLGIPADLFECQREEESRVLARQVSTPIEQTLKDARRIITAGGIPGDIKAKGVLILCRHAIEIAARMKIKQRRILRGERHDDVNSLIENNARLIQHLSLWLFDEPDKGNNDVYEELVHRYGADEGSAFKAVIKSCNKAAHGEFNVGANPNSIHETVTNLVDKIEQSNE